MVGNKMNREWIFHRKGEGMLLCLVILVCTSQQISSHRSSENYHVKSTFDTFARRILLHHRVTRNIGDVTGLSASITSTKGDSTAEDAYLLLDEQMQNQTLISGETASFKCKVESSPSEGLQFTWYKDNLRLEEAVDEPRIRIKQRLWGSRLIIEDVFTPDAGKYRCEVSNGYRRVHTSAFLFVSFSAVPLVPEDKNKIDALKGRCGNYTGFVCKEVLLDKYIYLIPFQNEENMEQQISTALNAITNVEGISSECEKYAKKALCYFLFPPCETNDRGFPLPESKPVSLCREDCDLLKHDTCKTVFFQRGSDSNDIISKIFNSAETDCADLPPTTSANPKCTSIGLPSVINRYHKCYNDTGNTYKGTLSITSSGETCQSWPSKLLFKYPELSGGHNFCRNPEGTRDAPWCYVDKAKTKKEDCQVPLCNFVEDGDSNLIMILIPAVSVPLLLGCFVLVFCVACRKKKKTVSHSKGMRVEMKALSAKKAKVPELSSNMVHVTGELGDGKFGKVFKAQVLSNLHYCPNEPVAVKTLLERATSIQIEDFQREMETFSELQHPNIAALKAVVVQPVLRCMLFEYTSGVDLHEYLVLHSPQADFTKPLSSASSHTSSTIDHVDFVRMGIQVSSGMEYLSSHNFIHRDLAARNVLICGNMDLKICNLGVVRDSYLSSYYRSPQGGQMLPIRWMAPESLRSWQFSDKSAVWSFGVLLWEMFSYGLQPYCGYNNHEVLDIISRHQLLTCPDQCPAKAYSLMHECWSSQPDQRPRFKDIHSKLVGWDGSYTTRMTSHLAQGIHRQLTNIPKDGCSGQYVPYGDQRGTIIDGINRILPNHSASPISGLPQSPPVGAPQFSPRLHLFHSSERATSASSGNSGIGFSSHYPGGNNNQRFMALPPLPSNPPYQTQHPLPVNNNVNHSKSSVSMSSSEYNQNSSLQVNNLTSHPEEIESASTCLPTSSQAPAQEENQGQLPPPSYNHCQDPIYNNQSLPQYQTPVYLNIAENNAHLKNSSSNGDIQNQLSRLSRSNSGVTSDVRMVPLSVYQEQGGYGLHERENRDNAVTKTKPIPAPKPHNYNTGSIPMTDNVHQNYGTNSFTETSPTANDEEYMPQVNLENESFPHYQSSNRVRDGATMCDSGFPYNETDQNLDSADINSQRPLLMNRQATSSRKFLNKNSSLVVPLSTSSSLSGSTQATLDTGISS